MASRALVLAMAAVLSSGGDALRLPLRASAQSRRGTLETAGKATAIAAGVLARGPEAWAQDRLFPDANPNLGPQDYLKDVEPNTKPMNIVITGASSGIGRDAAIKLVKRGHVVTVPCRTQDKAVQVCEEIIAEAGAFIPGAGVGVAVPMTCDLSSMASIRKFADAWNEEGPHRGKKGNGPLQVLALNAGVAPATDLPVPKRTKDGFEETVGVNHLGHFLLANLLLPELRCEAPGKDGAKDSVQRRLVVTASQVHDPDTPGGNVGEKAALRNLDGLRGGPLFEMADGGAFNGDKVYKDSKALNILFMKEAARRCAAMKSDTTVVALSPGLITRTGLFRDQKSLFMGVFDFVAYNVARVAETVDFGGDCLLAACIAPKLGEPESNGLFFTNSKPGKHTFEAVEVSKECQEEGKPALAWKLSEPLVELPPSTTCPSSA